MPHCFSPKVTQSLLLVVDIQVKLAPAMPLYEKVKKVASNLAAASSLHKVPILVTEQYKQGLGATDTQLQKQLGDACWFDKTYFSAYKEAGFKELIASYNKDHIIVVGMEAHVCVLQTCLDLLDHGYSVFLVVDGVCSRQDTHRDNAVAQLQSAGAVITNAETVIFQWTEVANSPLFKDILKIVK
ncbi:isochorismatase family protein [Pseudoalteromonas shioyasakiensis]|uniref:isochorismatase family protein n=1 Tax=Pseudoalteromonas shioyasakiensis TaxID=1190813 RepID=UPI0021177D4D|nr:isochorismatase family protein [Pseudoalteromonas shioyasakiensis]MCQ8878561.1 isochorismatase family protein [Pseudoalteromonas shioyasakiensis]